MERELDQAMLQYQPNHVHRHRHGPEYRAKFWPWRRGRTLIPATIPSIRREVYNRNLPIWMTYEPGSTFKIITLAAALEEGKVDLQHEHFFDPGSIEVGGASLRCWRKGGHGSQTFLEVVENSCNPGFVVLGQRLGKETLFDYIRNFGFGKKTGIDLSGEENGILFKPERVGPVELATTVLRPRRVGDADPADCRRRRRRSTAASCTSPMWPRPGSIRRPGESLEDDRAGSCAAGHLRRNVPQSAGSAGKRRRQRNGRNAFIDGYRVGGKTGTAQKVVDGRYSADEHIVSFIGFAPADDPQIVVYVAVDNPQGIQFGGLVAAPIVRNIMADALRYMKIEPRKDQLEKKYNYGEIPMEVVPDLVGMTISDIYEGMHMNFHLVKSGSGNVVVSQAPKAGTRVERGSTIRIYLADPPSNATFHQLR